MTLALTMGLVLLAALAVLALLWSHWPAWLKAPGMNLPSRYMV